MTDATISKKQYYYGLGRRKTSTATVRLFPGGDGTIQINGKSIDSYFGARAICFNVISAPLALFNQVTRYDIHAQVSGGGVLSQASAVAHAVARALLSSNEEFRVALRTNGLLTRDSRMKERKKPGLKRARKAPQYTKR